MGWACGIHGREKQDIQSFGGKTCMKETTQRMCV
jgi:hypothetical protein